MPIRKIADFPPAPKPEPKIKKDEYLKKLMGCLHPEHKPPTHISLTPGIYEHECPACHKTQTFTVHETMMIQ